MLLVHLNAHAAVMDRAAATPNTRSTSIVNLLPRNNFGSGCQSSIRW